MANGKRFSDGPCDEAPDKDRLVRVEDPEEEPKNPDRVIREIAEYHNAALDELLPGAVTHAELVSANRQRWEQKGGSLPNVDEYGTPRYPNDQLNVMPHVEPAVKWARARRQLPAP